MNGLMSVVRVLATIVCGPMLLVGGVWLLQGFNVLPGSFMTGHIQWAIYGGLLAVIGASLVFWVNRRRS
jgi:hypothetical protein